MTDAQILAGPVWGLHTPAPSPEEKIDLIEKHLANELSWMLQAASEWHVQATLNLGIGGLPIQVYAMDSAFLHARALFEFLTMQTCDWYYATDAFDVPKLVSKRYSNSWSSALHGGLIHMQKRDKPKRLTREGAEKADLNAMPVDLAREVIRLWRLFTAALQSSDVPEQQHLGQLAQTALDNAIEHTRPIFRIEKIVRDVEPLDWSAP